MENKSNPNLILFALALSAFAIGLTEFISVGLMPLLMQDFGISVELAVFIGYYDWCAYFSSAYKSLAQKTFAITHYAGFYYWKCDGRNST